MCWMNVFILQLLVATLLLIVLGDSNGIPLLRPQGVQLRNYVVNWNVKWPHELFFSLFAKENKLIFEILEQKNKKMCKKLLAK